MEYVFAALFVAGGILFAVAGYSNLVAARKRRAEWVAAEGTVIDFSEQAGDKGKTLYAPVYRYTHDGVEHTAVSKVASRPPGYLVGDPITILVNPAQPSESDVGSGAEVFTYPMMGLGLLVLVLGLFLAWLAFTGQMTFE